MADITGSGERGDMRHVVARLERLPYCSWHLKMRLIICTAWFFDAFDSITIAPDHRRMASQSAADRPAYRDRFCRPVGGRHRIWLACRTLGPPAVHVDNFADLLARRFGLRC